MAQINQAQMRKQMFHQVSHSIDVLSWETEQEPVSIINRHDSFWLGIMARNVNILWFNCGSLPWINVSNCWNNQFLTFHLNISINQDRKL